MRNGFLASKKHASRKDLHLRGEGKALYSEMMARLQKVTDPKAMAEDDSKGYTLFADPENRARQLKMREYALTNTPEVIQIALNAKDVEERQAASWLVGYTDKTDQTMKAICDATSDEDATVRNNAIRSLEVALSGIPSVRKYIRMEPILPLLRSGTWIDRNKASILVEQLSRSRDRRDLSLIRTKALPGILEMARWSNPPHSNPARIILGRVAGFAEEEISAKLQSGKFDLFVTECRSRLKG